MLHAIFIILHLISVFFFLLGLLVTIPLHIIAAHSKKRTKLTEELVEQQRAVLNPIETARENEVSVSGVVVNKDRYRARLNEDTDKWYVVNAVTGNIRNENMTENGAMFLTRELNAQH